MRQYHCGAVIVGGGAAGMCAALRAKEKMDAPVILVEMEKELGGNSSFAPIPDRKDYDISPEAAEGRYLDIMRDSRWRADARIVSTVSRKSTEAIQWLYNRIAHKNGTLTDRLADCCREAGVEILLETRVMELRKDCRGWMCGVDALCGGEQITIMSKCVILACGGFLGAGDLMEKYFPLYDENSRREIVLEGTPASGDGVRMALAAGAGDDCCVTFAVSPDTAPFYHGPRSKTMAALIDNVQTPEGIWVNNVGVRFTNEAQRQSFQAVYRQPNKEFFVIFDRGILERAAKRNEKIDLSVLDQEMPGLIQADEAIVTEDLCRLTAWIRGKTHIVYHTMERYNECCAAGRDFLFGKPAEFLCPFQKPPFYGFRLGLALRSTHGPVRTNPMMAVVDRFDAPVPALIACGADVAGLYPDGFAEDGHSIMWAITTGCLAGEHASGFEKGMGPAAPCEFPKFSAEEVLRGDFYNVGTAPGHFKVMGGIMERQADGSIIRTHLADSPERQGLQPGAAPK